MRKFYYIYCTLLALIFPTILLADNYVIINQVMYDAPYDELSGNQQSNEGEYVELYNAGTSSVSLQGWKLKGNGTNEVYTFQNVLLPAEKHMIVAYRKANSTFQLSNLYTIPGNSIDTIVYQNAISLSNGGESLTLCNAQNDTIDQIHYDGNDYTSDPYLLHASNMDNTPPDSCVSLHRTWVEFDAEGNAIIESSQWKTDYVSFGVAMLPYTSYQEEYITGTQNLPTGENYLLSITPLDPTTRIDINEDRPSVSSGVRIRANMQYMDGLGRTDEVIALGITPNNNDLVSVTNYYGTKKKAQQWLPVVMETEGQRISIANVQSQAQTDYDDSYPFSEMQYEHSARKRQISQKRPGESYENYPATQSYGLNSSSDNVLIYTVNNLNDALCTDGSYYEEATLYKTSSADEDGNAPLTTYTDKLGRKIMEERGSSRTYYVYDDLGRLRYILPNLSTSKLTNGSYNIGNNSVLKGIAYYYAYNERGNITVKKLPGCDSQYMVYDRIGQLILTQDGNQRENDKWTLYAYDSIGRNLYTAEIESSILPMNMHNAYANVWQVEHYVGNQSGAIPDVGYTCTAYGASNPRMLTVNYYDNYGYLSLLESEEQTRLGFVQESGYGRPCDNAVGRLTGTRIYNLSEAGSTITVYYYDIKGRVVQTRGTRNAGGYITTSTEYLFDGSVAQQLTIQGPDTALVREHYRYTYDHAGRAKNTYYQLNDGTEITLSAFSYDSIGRLAQNLLHNNLNTVSYIYDMRNMLTEINNKHFSEKLYYADDFSTSMQSVTKCHNGNIAAARTTYANSSNTYAYSYDSQNRLRNSYYMMKSRLRDSESFRYDNAGNILRLERYKGTRLIDDLAYTYSNDGHQLLSITDYGQDADLSTVIEYHDSLIHIPPTFSSMGYDANGNLTYDLDRNIVAISYNILNLPDTIQFGNGNQIVNLYDATGHKYRSIVYTVPSTAITPVLGIVHYALDVDTIDYHVTEYAGSVENHYMRTDTTQRIHNAIGYYTDGTYYHYLKDHLGNICSVVNSNTDAVVQKIQYYASGVPMQSNTLGVQPYLYNGKELVTAHELDSYDYGFRNYYATIGRFTSIDPLTEQTPWHSPYSYAGNRFVNAIDWMGLSGVTSLEDGDDVLHYIVINKEGFLLGGVDDGDMSIYIDKDGSWKEEDGKEGLLRVGRMIWSFSTYMAKMIDANGHYKVPGWYDGQWTISFGVSFGLNIQEKLNLLGTKILVGLDLVSYELLNFSLTNKDDYLDISYITKNNRVRVSHGFGVGIYSFEQSFLVYASDLEPVPRTTKNTHSLVFEDGWKGIISPNGTFNLTYNYGFFGAIAISIVGNFYYQHQENGL